MPKPALDLITSKEESVTMSRDRLMICLGAAWELDALAMLLPKLVSGNEEQEHLLVRGVAGRIKSLSEVLMSVLDDDMETTDNLKRKLMVAD
ncbi:MAG: hypothetical protein Q8L62_05905 [Candidatus Nitrotoga sp.]|nr:hypothetical protein [Candidatus Nitrotoga sp.]